MKKTILILFALPFLCSAQFIAIGSLPPGATVTVAPFDQLPSNVTRYGYEVDESGGVVNSVSAFVAPPAGFPITQYWALGTIFDFQRAGDKFTGIVNGKVNGFTVWDGSGAVVDPFGVPGSWTLDIHEMTLADGKYYVLGRRDTMESYGYIRHFAAFVIDSASKSVLWSWSTKEAEGNPLLSPDSSLALDFNKYHFNSFGFYDGVAVISARYQGVYFVDSLSKSVSVERCGCYQHTATMQGDTLTYFSNGASGDTSAVVRTVGGVEVWRWSHPMAMYAPFSGSVVVNGRGFLIGWGGAPVADTLPDVTLINRSGLIEWELFIDGGISYRAGWGQSLPLMRDRLKSVRRREDWWGKYNLLGQEK